jgi:ABC-type bacteriocin/lantibiotic exporter with double-glycine peptidase domain
VKIIFKILSEKQRKKLTFILSLMIAISLLEFLSIGAILPLLEIIFTNSLDIKTSNFLIKFFDINENSIIILLSLIFFAFLFKNIFILIYTKFSSAFMMHLSLDIQRKTFEKYLYRNYEELRNVDSNEILRDINIESRLVVAQFISPLLTMILNLLIIFLIIILLFLYNYKTTLIISISLVILFIVFKLIFSEKLKKLGLDRQVYQKDILKSIKQTFDGYRELSTYNYLNLFQKIFVIKSIKLANNGMRRSVLTVVPKLVLETLVIFIIVAGIGLMYLNGYQLNEIILNVTVYTVAGLRVFPVFVAIVNAYQNLDYSSASVKKIKEIYEKKNDEVKNNLEKIIFKDLISLKDVSYFYGKKEVLNYISLNISKNSFLGITGPSGCGKSTLVDLISGLTKPSKGVIQIDDININNLGKNWSNQVAYVQQSTFIFDTTFIRNITLNDNDNYDKELLKLSLEVSNLESFVNHLDDGLMSKLGEFGSKISGGQQQRIGLARAIYKNCQLIILDEGLSNVDFDTKEKILSRLIDLKNNKTIIYVSHDLGDLKKCDDIFELK